MWANEQAIRELYLKPFELTVKEGNTTAIMSSYSHLGTTWAGASKALLTDVLRGEWGFTGMVVTDSAMGNTAWMDPNLAVRAGNDMMLCLMGASIETDNNTARNAMRAACHNILYTQANSAAVQVEADNTPYWYALVALFNAIVLSAILLLVLKLIRKDKKLGILGAIVPVIVFALSALFVWFGFIKPVMAKKSAALTEATEPAATEVPAETKPPEAETQPAETAPTASGVAPENGMELYELANGWLGCRVTINADGTYRVSYDYTEDAKDIEAEVGTWTRVSDTELTLTAENGDTKPVILADGKWSMELTEANTSTVCHPFIEVNAAPAEAANVSPENGMELYELANGWLGCRVAINADGTYRVSYDYTEDAKDIEAETGTWTRVSDTELTLTAENGDTKPVVLADGKWSVELTEANTSTVCHPFIEAGAPAASAEVTELELYDLADFWLGCHVYLNADKTFSVTYDYTEDAKGIESMKGTWEQLSATEIQLTAEDGATVPVTNADGAWSCELVEPNTQTICRPKAEGAAAEPAAAPAEPEKVTYLVVYTEPDGTVYTTVETADATVIPEVETPKKDGFLFAGWQSKPDVAKDELVLGVSPYEVTTGASSLYGGAGTAITDYELMNGNMLLLYPRWVEATEIHNAEELKGMKDDLTGWYVLAADIDLAGENWQPIGKYFSNYETVNAPYWTYAFRGTFDGAGHTIRNLTITMDGCKADLSAFEGVTPVWRNDGEALGSEAAFFGATAKAEVRNVTFENPIVTVTSDNDATPYAAVVAGFDLASTIKDITVSGAKVSATANDANLEKRQSTWAAVSSFMAGGWSTTIENCEVVDASVTLNGTLTKSHGGEFYAGAMLGEGYAFMDGNKANGTVDVSLRDESAAEADAELVVNVGGMGGTNTTQHNGNYDTTINVAVNKPAGKATVSIGGLTGSQRYQVAENNVIRAAITTDCALDPEQGRLYIGKVIGSTNVPYCIVQLIFAGQGDVEYAGCRNNDAAVTHNGEAVAANKGEQLMVNDQPLTYIANGDIEADGVTYASNINDVIAVYGSAVPSSFLQKAVIVLVDE